MPVCCSSGSASSATARASSRRPGLGQRQHERTEHEAHAVDVAALAPAQLGQRAEALRGLVKALAQQAVLGKVRAMTKARAAVAFAGGAQAREQFARARRAASGASPAR